MSGEDSLWEDGHSIFRPSYSATWLNCEDALISGLQKPDVAGRDAAVGTVFHSLMADWQRYGDQSRRLNEVVHIFKQFGDITEEPWEIVIDDDMFIYGQDCLNYLEQFEPSIRLVEQRVDISDLTPIPDQGGTADNIFLSPGRLVVTDFKYGLGVQVFAEWNTQMLLYAWGAFTRYDWIFDFQTIEVHVLQPRLRHYDKFVITREQLIEWAAWAKERAAAAWKKNKNRTRTPSPKACLWCRVNTDCPALEALREEIADVSFDDALKPEGVGATYTQDDLVNLPARPIIKQLPDPVKLTTEQLSYIYRHRRLMESWFGRIAGELISRGLDGEDLIVWNVVEGRTRRVWRDEMAIAAELEELGAEQDEIWISKLVSPNKAKPLFRRSGIRGKALDAHIAARVDRPPGQPTLAPSSDARSALPDYSDSFEDFDETEDDL